MCEYLYLYIVPLFLYLQSQCDPQQKNTREKSRCRDKSEVKQLFFFASRRENPPNLFEFIFCLFGQERNKQHILSLLSIRYYTLIPQTLYHSTNTRSSQFWIMSFAPLVSIGASNNPAYRVRYSMYDIPPSEKITLEEFEKYSIDRLKGKLANPQRNI